MSYSAFDSLRRLFPLAWNEEFMICVDSHRASLIIFLMSEHALDAIPKTYEDAVRVLAYAHVSGPDPVEIYSLPDPQQQVVRLIEVSAAFPEGAVERPAQPTGVERVVPVFPMGRAKDFPFRSEIVQVTPVEWTQLQQGNLNLNRDWGDLSLAHRVEHGE